MSNAVLTLLAWEYGLHRRSTVEYMLRATGNGSMEAADHFPRVLDCVSRHADDADVVEAFTTHLAHVPSWMLLRWTGQLMAHLDKPHAGVVVSVLLRMARAFPQALFYPFKVNRTAMPAMDEAVVEPLAAALANPLLETFCVALNLYVVACLCRGVRARL